MWRARPTASSPRARRSRRPRSAPRPQAAQPARRPSPAPRVDGAGTQLAEALALGASAPGQLGRFDELESTIAVAREAAPHRRHLYLDLLLDGLAVGWLAMRGEQTAAQQALAHMAALGGRMDLAQLHQGLAAAMFCVLVWQPGGPA